MFVAAVMHVRRNVYEELETLYIKKQTKKSSSKLLTHEGFGGYRTTWVLNLSQLILWRPSQLENSEQKHIK